MMPHAEGDAIWDNILQSRQHVYVLLLKSLSM